MSKKEILKGEFLKTYSNTTQEELTETTTITTKLFETLEKEEKLKNCVFHEFENYFEDEDVTIRGADMNGRQFDIIFSDNMAPQASIPLTSLLRKAKEFTKKSLEEINRLLYESENGRSISGEATSIISSVLDENSDLGMSLVTFLFPLDTYFVSLAGEKTVWQKYDIYKYREAETMPYRTIKVIEKENNKIKFLYDETFILSIEFVENGGTAECCIAADMTDAEPA